MATTTRKAPNLACDIFRVIAVTLSSPVFPLAAAQQYYYDYPYTIQCPPDHPVGVGCGYNSCCDEGTTCGDDESCGFGNCCIGDTNTSDLIPVAIAIGALAFVCCVVMFFYYIIRNRPPRVIDASTIVGTITPISMPDFRRPKLPDAPEPGSPNWICPNGHLNAEPGQKCDRKRCRAVNPHYKPPRKLPRVNTASQPGLPSKVVALQPPGGLPVAAVIETQPPAFVAISVQS